MYKSILVPVDDQEQSYAAIRVAGMMAACDKADITLFHVRKPPLQTVTDIVTEDRLFALPLMEHESRMFERCRAILSSFSLDPAVKVVESPDTARAIIGECGSGGYDVIVMGHRGRKALKQLVLGSVASGVLAGASCPAIMVHVPG